jgi:3-oxoacyl-[acyl-carrier-protein] synthase II
MPPRARIAGVGLVTPLGVDAERTWDRLLGGAYVGDHCRAAGGWDRKSERARAAEMAIRVAREAVAQAGWGAADDDASCTAIVVGTSKGTIERWVGRAKHMSRGACVAGGMLEPAGLGDIAALLGSEPGFAASPRLTVSGACASGLLALIRGALLIRCGDARRALVVASEASVHPLFLGSFARLGVLARQGGGCRPFDHARDGFLMSEAAAAICLESDGLSASAAGESSNVTIDRFAMGGDATHLTAGDPEGGVLRHLIRTVTADAPIDLIHAHGTGTIANDPIELAAIEDSIVGTSTPCLYSHKGALGHSLGAAGLVAVALNWLAHRDQIVPGNVRTTQPLATSQVTLSAAPVDRPVRRSLALAAGFGGTAAAVALRSA